MASHSTIEGRASARVAILVLVAGAAAMAPAGTVSDPARPIESIPFRYDGHIFLPVVVNGADALLVFDPIQGVVLDRRFVQRAALRHQGWRELGEPGPTRVRGAGPAEVEVSWAPNLRVTLGESEFTFPRAPVIPLDSMMPGSFRLRVDGLFGIDLLAGFAARFDFANEQLDLLPPGGAVATGATLLDIESLGGKPVVAAELTLPDGTRHRLRLMLDFGMTGGIRLATRTVDSLQLIRHLGAVPRRTRETGLGGALESFVGEAPSIRLGAIELRGYQVSLARETTGADAYPRWDGLIGLALLSRYAMTYDPSRSRLVLEGPSASR